MRYLLLTFILLATTGCAEIIFGIGSLIASGIGVYQRYEDRQAQKDQTEEIKNLKEAVEKHQEEVRKLRESTYPGMKP